MCNIIIVHCNNPVRVTLLCIIPILLKVLQIVLPILVVTKKLCDTSTCERTNPYKMLGFGIKEHKTVHFN